MKRSQTTLAGLADGGLVERYRAGSEQAGSLLVERHWPRAWRAAYAVLGDRPAADDAAQSAIERAFTEMDRFDTSRPFGPWIDRIAVNQALNILRARRREVELVDEFPVADLYPEIAERDEVARALGSLSEEQRLVVVLRYWADMTPSEIAGALDAPVGTVSSRLARALVALRTVLEEVTPQ